MVAMDAVIVLMLLTLGLQFVTPVYLVGVVVVVVLFS